MLDAASSAATRKVSKALEKWKRLDERRAAIEIVLSEMQKRLDAAAFDLGTLGVGSAAIRNLVSVAEALLNTAGQTQSSGTRPRRSLLKPGDSIAGTTGGIAEAIRRSGAAKRTPTPAELTKKISLPHGGAIDGKKKPADDAAAKAKASEAARKKALAEAEKERDHWMPKLADFKKNCPGSAGCCSNRGASWRSSRNTFKADMPGGTQNKSSRRWRNDAPNI